MDFETLTFTRRLPCSAERAFHILTDRAMRERWGKPHETTRLDIDHHDFRVGGTEVSRCGPTGGPEFHATVTFHVIEAPRLMICTEVLTSEAAPMVVNLATHEIADDGDGVRLDITLQLSGRDGDGMADGFREGWSLALDNMVRMAEAVPA